MPSFLRRNIAVGIFVLLLSGCATVESFDFQHRRISFRDLPFPFPYHDYSGIFHIHSRYSDDSKGRFDEIVKAAAKAGADFVVITDHNTLQGLREKMDGFYGKILVIIGDELSTPSGHLVILGTDKEMGRSRNTADILRELENLGALSFVAHGESKHHPWKDWTLSPLTGMEVYNLASDVYEGGKFWAGLKALIFPPRFFFRFTLKRPNRFLKRWDQLLAERKIVGMGAVDAHQKVRFFGRVLDSYRTMFKVVQTHVWAENFSAESILEALKKGHAYVGFDRVTPVRNFLFLAEGHGQTILMGDKAEFHQDIKLKVFLPQAGEIRLLYNGALMKAAKGDYLEIEAPQAGVYRVEVYRQKRLWILSNPVYLS